MKKKSAKKKTAEEPTVFEEYDFNKRYFLVALWAAFGRPFLSAAVLRVFRDATLFFPPIIVRQLIRLAEGRSRGWGNHPGYEAWKGYFYAVLLFLAVAVQSCLFQQYFSFCVIAGMHARSALIAAVYEKSLRLSTSARRTLTSGEIVNLMAVDCARVMEMHHYFHLTWAAPLLIGVVAYFLWDVLGPSSLVALGVMVVLAPINGIIISKVKALQIKQMALKDERIKMINEMLNGVKVLKLYAWEPPFLLKVNAIRAQEMLTLRKMGLLNAVTSGIFVCLPNLVTLITFLTYVCLDPKRNRLDAETAFVALVYFGILQQPMSQVPMTINNLIQASVSIKRLNSFLRAEEIEPYVKTIAQGGEEEVRVVDASFRWNRDGPLTLKHLNMSFRKGSLVAIVGPLGSGKSSLIAALLDGLVREGGHVAMNSPVAYVPEQPWIQNTTLQKNILFNLPFDDTFYESVIWCCALEPDLILLPSGDQTLIGEKGVTLSGGQKQRVSLARAVFSRYQTVLLDAPLSAVDAHVGRHIFDKAIGPDGMLGWATRIFVTHNVEYLPRCDYVYVMVDGAVAEAGTYTDLIAAKGRLWDLVNAKPVAVEEPKRSKMEDNLVELQQQYLSAPKKGSFQNFVQRRSSARPKSMDPSVSATEADLSDQPQALPPPMMEEAEVGRVQMKVVRAYLAGVGPAFVVFGIFFFVAQQVCDIVCQIWVKEWTKDYSSPNHDGVESNDLGFRAGVFAAVVSTEAFCVGGAAFCLTFGNVRAARKLHEQLLENVIRCPMHFFDLVPQGRILNRFSKDIDTVDVTLPNFIREFLFTFARVLGIFVIISYGAVLFLTVVPFLVVAYFLIQLFYLRTSRQLKRLESVSRSPIYSHYGESLQGSAIIRAFGQESLFVNKIFRCIDDNVACYYAGMMINRWLALRLELMGSLVVLLAALFSVAKADKQDPATTGLTVSAAIQITQGLNWLVRMTCEVENNIVSVERIVEYAQAPREADWVNPKERIEPGWPRNGDIVFENAALRYRMGLPLVLKGISLKVLGGEKVGIVGRTGAGKSSLTLAVFRLTELARGRILIDGVDIAGLGLHTLRGRLSIIPQDPVLFLGTLRSNLDPFAQFADDRLWAALEAAHLSSFVKTLPDGLDYRCTEGGENLSLGQRQLLCLARALLRDSKILVLDEATAAIDNETDALLQETIRSRFSSCTILTIAHRLNTVIDYDRILVLEAGRIAEFDTPANLLKSKGVFHSLYTQKAGPTEDG